MHFMFGSTVGFSRSAGRMALFQFRQNGWAAILKTSNGDISAADHPIYSVFGCRMEFSGSADSNGANSGLSGPNSIDMWEKTMHED